MAEKKSETQASVTEWCEEHYPGQDVPTRLRDLFEEATELAASLGVVDVEELVDVVRKSWAKSDVGNKAETPGEIADVTIATSWLASGLKLDVQEALDDKMAVNRAKTVEQSQARVEKKNRIFKGPKS
jgi:NTP pyrophosphatase (non-canonical NTP hydrolase)